MTAPKKPTAKSRILQRVAELGHWPAKRQLAEEIGCTIATVTEVKREAERKAEEERVKSLKSPCQYCRRHEQGASFKACDECSTFLVRCFHLGELTLRLRNDVYCEPQPLDLNRAKAALSSIVAEWITRRTDIEVWGDQMCERQNNRWFYEGDDPEAYGLGTDEFEPPEDDE